MATIVNAGVQGTGSIIPPSPAVPINPTTEQLAARTAATTPPTKPVAPTSSTPTYGSVTPQQETQAPSEPAVISSSSIPKTIADNNQTLDKLSTKGTYIGADGNMYYSDHSLVPAPSGAQSNGDGTWSMNGQSYGAEPDYVNAGNDADLQKVNDLLSSLKASSDSSTKAQLDSIHQQFDHLRQQQEEINNGANASRQNALLRAGTARYSPLTETGTMATQLSYGLTQIANLDAKENAALAQAKAAQDSNNQKLMDQALSIVQQARKDKQDAAQKIIDQQQTQLQKTQDATAQATKDNAIASVITSGETDPAKILSALSDKGYTDITASDVNNVLKTVATSLSTTTSGLTGDVKNFFALQQKGQLPTSIANLPADEQLTAYITAINQAKKTQQSGDFTLGGNSIRYDEKGNIIAVGAKVNAPASSADSAKQMSKDIESASTYLEMGISGKGYNGRGSDGYVDPNLYVALYNAAGTQYGSAGQAAFLKKFPPGQNINPANVGNLPDPINNAVLDYASKHTKKTVQIG